MNTSVFNLKGWLEASTQASQVPLKVRHAEKIRTLQLLVSRARRTKTVKALRSPEQGGHLSGNDSLSMNSHS